MSYELARTLAKVAGILESRGDAFAPVVRRGARALLDVPEPTEEGCRGCGSELAQPRTGRRRVWCCEACRSRARRR